MKIAARYLLPLEMFMAVSMFGWGLSGWKGHGILWQILAEHRQENFQWGVALCSVGLAQFAVTLGEWFFGKGWSNGSLLLIVRARFWLAFLSMIVWVYVCYFIFTTHGAIAVLTLFVQAPTAAIFQACIGVGNLKVATMLDPSVRTTRLQRAMHDERQSSLTGG